MLLSFHQSRNKWLVNAGRLKENVNPSEQPWGCRARSRTAPWQAGKKVGTPGSGLQPLTCSFPCCGRGRDQSPGAPPALSPALSIFLQFWAIAAALSPSRSRKGSAPRWIEAMPDPARSKGYQTTPGTDPAGASPELYTFSPSIDHPWLKSELDPPLNTPGCLCIISGTS